MKNEEPLTTGEVAKYCHVSRVTVLEWIKACKLDAYCLPGGHYRVQRKTFLDFMEKHRMPVSEELFSE